MDTTDLHYADATETARRIRARELTSVECLERYIARIERYNPSLNAIVVSDFERARARALAADQMLQAGEIGGPLHGVPISVKEAFDVAGLPTTFGIPGFENSLASGDAAVVSRLKAAGAVLLGKTNVPIGLGDFQSYNAIYGTTNNPWDLARTPGGSSGGESAALAAGLCALGCGSDIGGSLRNPAHYTGTYSHKPTFGIVPSDGHSPVPSLSEPDLGVYGPMARSARDLSLALSLIAGPGQFAAPGYRLELPRVQKPLSALRVAVWPDDPMAPVAAELAERCQRVAEALARAGASVSDSARPGFSARDAHACYVKLLQSALSIGEPEDTLLEACRRASAHDPADRSDPARRAWNRVMPHRRWLVLHEQRQRVRLAWRAFFEDWDIVICPVACTTAFPHDHRPFGERSLDVDGVQRPYFNQLFWAGLATASYLPSTVIPTGRSRAGLPIGVQLIGPEFHDYATIDVAHQLSELGFAFSPPPNY